MVKNTKVTNILLRTFNI